MELRAGNSKTYDFNENIAINLVTAERAKNQAFLDAYVNDALLFIFNRNNTAIEKMLIDMCHQNDIDPLEIKSDPYGKFLLMHGIKQWEKRHCVLFGNFDLYKLKYDYKENALVDENGKTIIDKEVYNELSVLFCYICNVPNTKRRNIRMSKKRKEANDDNS